MAEGLSAEKALPLTPASFTLMPGASVARYQHQRHERRPIFGGIWLSSAHGWL
jgi:hypothetical protein